MTDPRPIADLVARLREPCKRHNPDVVCGYCVERREAAAALEECARKRDEARRSFDFRAFLDHRRVIEAAGVKLSEEGRHIDEIVAEIKTRRERMEARIADLERRLAAPLPEEIEPLLLDMRRWVASTRKQAHPWDALINNTLCLADRAADLLARAARALADAQQEAAILRKLREQEKK